MDRSPLATGLLSRPPHKNWLWLGFVTLTVTSCICSGFIYRLCLRALTAASSMCCGFIYMWWSCVHHNLDYLLFQRSKWSSVYISMSAQRQRICYSPMASAYIHHKYDYIHNAYCLVYIQDCPAKVYNHNRNVWLSFLVWTCAYPEWTAYDCAGYCVAGSMIVFQTARVIHECVSYIVAFPTVGNMWPHDSDSRPIWICMSSVLLWQWTDLCV